MTLTYEYMLFISYDRRWGCRNSIITIYCAQLSDHDYLENLSQNPSWI